MRSVALSTEQPCGMVGRLNWTRARRLPPFFDMTLRIESEPLLLVVLPESIQASAVAVRVCCAPQFDGGALDRPRVGRGRLVGVPGGVGRADPEGVGWPTARPV